MINGKTLCLNMIVRDEIANLERCLSALVDHVDCWVIGDTGSTDGTQNFIRSFFAARGKPGELHSFPFQNFGQARNAALDCANGSRLDYDYLLLADADMELVVEDARFRERLEAPGYRLLQRTSALEYWNVRLIRRNAGARYHGVTHEYVEVPGGAKDLRGVWYKDHASGSNRKGKYERDIGLLSAALEQDPGNRRYWFYLAQSYRDAGRTEEAAQAYAKRAEMGGWDEEAWNARLNEARCLRKLGNEGGFVCQALAAFNMRPQRAEPLYDLARFYREKGMNDVSLLFSEAGLAIERPEQDLLFLEEFVYTAGLQEEYSITANYVRDPARKDRGFAACNWLALNRAIPDGTRALARSNLFFYVTPVRAMLPSFAARRVGFDAPGGYRPLNPAVTRLDQQIVVMLETVNHELTGDGRYETPNNAPVQVRNFLLRLGDDLDIQSAAEILPPVDMPEVAGLQDLRLFTWRGGLWGSACRRERVTEGWCEQVLARIDGPGAATCRLTDWQVLRPEGPKAHERNWMPQAAGERLRFVRLCDPTQVVDDRGATVTETTPAIAAGQFRGGSQLIAFDGGWLALIHEVQRRLPEKWRFYQHRFVWFDETNRLCRVSRPFFFHKKGVEVAAGLAWHPDADRLLISYGVADSEAWIATVSGGEVRAVLEDAEHLPSAKSSRTLDRVAEKVSLAKAKPSPPPEPGSDSTKIVPVRRDRDATARARAYTELEVNGEVFDQPVSSQVRVKIIICSTPRTGSYLLCRAMIHAGIGIPHEYFNRMNAGIIGTRYGLGTITTDDLEADGAKRRAYIAALLERRTVNGIFAVKIQHGQFEQYFKDHSGIDLFKGARFIYIYREDLVAQAISSHMSLLTGRWSIDDTVTTRPAANPDFFDNSLIMEIMEQLATQDREWRLSFAKNGIQPLFLSYEGIKDDLSAALRRIVTSFGLNVPSENCNYTEPPVAEYRGPGEPSKSEVRARFSEWLQKQHS